MVFNTGEECPICMEAKRFAVATNCGHEFCGECLEAAIRHRPNCPICRAPIAREPAAIVSREQEPELIEISDDDEQDVVVEIISSSGRGRCTRYTVLWSSGPQSLVTAAFLNAEYREMFRAFGRRRHRQAQRRYEGRQS